MIAILCAPLNSQLIAENRILGHNLTPTTSVLREGEVMIGTYAAGYGLTENLSIGTSVWLDIDYSMPNVGLKYAFDEFHENATVTLEGLYFKTFPYGEELFDQESYFIRGTVGWNISEFLDSYIAFGHQFFVNDRRAYSLRAVPQRSDPRTLSLSTLHVLHLREPLALLVEIGSLGLNYPVPFIHYGASVNVRINSWMLQLGMTTSKSMSPIDFEVDRDGRTYWSGTSRGRVSPIRNFGDAIYSNGLSSIQLAKAAHE